MDLKEELEEEKQKLPQIDGDIDNFSDQSMILEIDFEKWIQLADERNWLLVEEIANLR